MYFNGRGVQKDYRQAADWYQKAAEQGDAVAQAGIGYMCRYGIGVERDRIGSLRWYRMAAAQGNPDAKRYLSSLKPSRTKRHIELGFALFELIAGVFLLLPGLDFLLPWKKISQLAQPFIALLGAAFLAEAALSFYASAHDLAYSPYHNAFHLAKRILMGIAIVIVFAVILPAKKKLPEPGPVAE